MSVSDRSFNVLEVVSVVQIPPSMENIELWSVKAA